MVHHAKYSVPRHTNRFAALGDRSPDSSKHQSEDSLRLEQADRDSSIEAALLKGDEHVLGQPGRRADMAKPQNISQDAHSEETSEVTASSTAHLASEETQERLPLAIGAGEEDHLLGEDMPPRGNDENGAIEPVSTSTTSGPAQHPPPDLTGLSQGLSRLSLEGNAPVARETIRQQEMKDEELENMGVNESDESPGYTFASRYTPEYLRSLYPASTVTHHVNYTTHYRPAITHEVIRPQVHEVVEVHRTRSIHIHEHRQAVQPIQDPDRNFEYQDRQQG
jgi:hypothetical protein